MLNDVLYLVYYVFMSIGIWSYIFGIFGVFMNFRSDPPIDCRPRFIQGLICFFIGCFIKLFVLKNYEPFFIGLFVLSIVWTICIGISMTRDHLENKKYKELKKRWEDEYPLRINAQVIADDLVNKLGNLDNYETKKYGKTMYAETPNHCEGFIKIKDKSFVDELITEIKNDFRSCINFQTETIPNEDNTVFKFSIDGIGYFVPSFIDAKKYNILDYEIAKSFYCYSNKICIEFFKYYDDEHTDVMTHKTIEIPGLEEIVKTNKKIVLNEV